MRRFVLIVVVCLLAGSLASGGDVSATAARSCGLTTLESTIRVKKDGTLRCDEGRPIVVRDDFVKPKPGRRAAREPVTSFFTIADVQLADEESPLRGEWADKCRSHPAESAFRPQEAMVGQLLNGHVAAANAIAERGSPVLDSPFEFVVGLGDLADNQQYNEIRWVIDLFDGGKIVDPDSGADGYDGVQGEDPRGAGGEAIDSPVKGQSLLDLANEPFWAEGLFASNRAIPWYSLPGNHDIKVQGTVPDDDPVWRNLVRRWAIGNIKLMDLAPDYQKRVCAGDPSVFQEIFSDPRSAGTTKIVPADANRLPLYRSDEAKQSGDEQGCIAATGLEKLCRTSWVEEHFTTSGIPVGHGYNESRCADEDGELLPRACYSFDRGKFHYIALDSNPAEGFDSGSIDDAQFRWLERELTANSTRYYRPDGKKATNRKGRNKLIVVFSHHTLSSMDNEAAIAMGEHDGDDLRELLLRFPNVILHANGHTHQNKIWARGSDDDRKDTGYWEVNTSAIVDYPHQSRTIEIADNRDGTLSIFAVVFDAAVPPNVRAMAWAADPSDETEHGHEHHVNEDWLASYGREVGYHDPQKGYGDLTKLGKPGDRNVELVLRAPFRLGGSGGGGGARGGGNACLAMACAGALAGLPI